MKYIALNLPQFHTIPENDRWWGKGFTEWTNVRRARPVYEGHVQPQVPLGENYYDMTDLSTLRWQSELALRYGIDGFCYYHYWFNGKLLLQRPCELMLGDERIRSSFCFCWANESWMRTWDGTRRMLVEQRYGDEEEWRAHIRYLLPFLQDPRYLRIGDRPVFFLYSIEKITCWEEMYALWQRELERVGIPGLFVVEFITAANPGSRRISGVDAICEFEPHSTARFDLPPLMLARRLYDKRTGHTDFLDYDDLWRRILNKHHRYHGEEIIRSAFTGFDNTPRKQERALIVRGSSPQKFERYLRELERSASRRYSSELTVINAWNEWAEGAVLEPTQQQGYGYLEAVSRVTQDFR